MNLTNIGLLVILIGFVIVISSLLLTHKADAKYSFVGFIGPFPIGFGNDKRLMMFTLILGIAIFLAFLLFYKNPLR